MAEAIAVVGILASFIQLTEFSIKLAHRVHSFTSATSSAPDSLRHVAVELPALLEALKNSAQVLSAENLTEDVRCALEAPIRECAGEIEALNKILLKVLPDPGNRKGKRIWKGVWSLRYDAKIRNRMAVVRGYVQTLSYYHVTILCSKSTPVKALPKPLPTSTVPYHRNADYVDTGTLRQVGEKLTMPASRLALVGMGGIGKTQLALEYAHLIREKSPKTWVFWINTLTRTTLEYGCRKIAEATKLPGWDNPKANTLELARTWLYDERNGPWLLILDAADDHSITGQRPIADFIPQSPNGSVLVTSRDLGIANHLKFKDNEIINLEPMNQESASLLLSRSLGSQLEPQSEVAADLVEKLEYLPLAITRAAAYLRLNQRISPQKYIETLGEVTKQANIMAATWTVSYERIQHEHPSACRLFSLMTVLSRQTIPECLLEEKYEKSLEELSTSRVNSTTNSRLNEDKFDQDISILMEYSLVAMNKKDEFEILQDVRSATKRLLEAGSEFKQRNIKAINEIQEDFPGSTNKTHRRCNEAERLDLNPPELVETMRLELKVLEKKLLLLEPINFLYPLNLFEDMSPSAIETLVQTPSLTSLESYFEKSTCSYLELNGANTPKQLIGNALKERVNTIDHESCEAGDEDTFFVADLGEVYRQHMRWKKNLPRVKPFYAVKCNPDPQVIRLLAELGTGFDCASKAEIEQVLKAGVEPNRIIYAQPCKTNSYVRYAAAQGVKQMTFDNTDELYKIKKLFPGAELFLRISTDDSSSLCQLSLKFGAAMDTTDNLLALAKELELNVVGVSFHVGSGASDPGAFIKAVQDARCVFDQAETRGFSFHTLDVGGGFSSETFDEMAAVLSSALDEYMPSNIQVIGEPGRYYVASAFTLACHVIARRTIKNPANGGDSYMLYMNDGLYGNFSSIMFDHQNPVAQILRVNGRSCYDTIASQACSDGIEYSIWGPTCDGIDQISKSIRFNQILDVGDWLYFEEMGAYTKCSATRFNGFSDSHDVIYVARRSIKKATQSDGVYG
ncbi:hypothetical protein HYALB_00002570 [Hymenoscyphus albidus]|uniref:Ornithine decarboxylase n=1 Tax=Hymenoscyphus albidus TaxID=595503 RepID=A0A9N9LY37_9HELO|nr:hypothetical protein HYALB_00002570 [Hymenoscyphus albidus]